jgi:hypothetical protein
MQCSSNVEYFPGRRRQRRAGAIDRGGAFSGEHKLLPALSLTVMRGPSGAAAAGAAKRATAAQNSCYTAQKQAYNSAREPLLCIAQFYLAS